MNRPSQIELLWDRNNYFYFEGKGNSACETGQT